jgi:retron-type reverse transcriptase
MEFASNLEENLITIQNELIYETYKPSRYNEFIIREPKERLILALPFRDRVVHQAICAVIEPLFENTFISDSYACRKGKGTIAGVKRVEKFVKKELRNEEVFCLKMDIQKYFYSIDHATIKKLLKRKIRCKKTLNLLNVIIDSTDNPGIPVGNLTSQLFANIYLNQVDHFIKETLRIKHYVRYMDDMIILSKNKKQLWVWLSEIRNFLNTELRLTLNKKTSVFNIKRGIDFLGYRQFPQHRILGKRVMVKNIRKFKKFVKVNIGMDKIQKSLASLNGLCKHCNSEKFMRNIKNILEVAG